MKFPTLLGLRYRSGLAWSRFHFALSSIFDCGCLALSAGAAPWSITGVVAGRNDDYMPDFEHRLLASLEWNLRYLLTDAIFVEWNTAPDRPLLAPRLAERVPMMRAYVVPPSVHEALGGTSRVPMLEFHAKNVGLRRAGSPWILATNADALVGYSVARSFRKAQPTTETAWTAQRVDIPWREGRTKPASLRDTLWYKRIIPNHALGTGEFLLAARELWHRAGGYDETSTSQRIGIDKRGAAQLAAHGAALRSAGRILHMAHPTSCTEGVRPHHGEMASLEGLPYLNASHWGLASAREIQVADRVWRLEL